MAQRVNLDAMIPREDFGVDAGEFVLDLFPGFPISYLTGQEAPILKLLRKPDFQRETNHWSPDQITTLVASFLDNEVIPSLILWKSPNYIFVIDGGHRLSALRAWVEDDYGDRAVSGAFYKGEISNEQKKIATSSRRTQFVILASAAACSMLMANKPRRSSLMTSSPWCLYSGLLRTH